MFSSAASCRHASGSLQFGTQASRSGPLHNGLNCLSSGSPLRDGDGKKNGMGGRQKFEGQTEIFTIKY